MTDDDDVSGDPLWHQLAADAVRPAATDKAPAAAPAEAPGK